MINYSPTGMKGWKSLQVDRFKGHKLLLSFKHELFFIPYRRWSIWYEMRFDLNLN